MSTTEPIDLGTEPRGLFSAARTEAQFYDLWHQHHMAYLEPAAMAFRGGYHASCLPFVFLSGYQATLHHAFPAIPKTGWTALAVSEDRKNPGQNPPTTACFQDDKVVLNGSKSWVAASRHVDHLIVTAKEQGGEKPRLHCILVPREAQGLTLTHRGEPSFLTTLSQGRAHFNDVTVDKSDCFDDVTLRTFSDAEPPFVMLAASGYLLQALGDQCQALKDNLLEIATSLSALCQAGSWTDKRLAYLDRMLQAAVADFTEAVDCDALADWDRDCRLLSLYSTGLQKRAGD